VAPGTYGPAIVHFLRSGEWKMKPPFFVPTDTTTLPFLIAPATLTTCNAGESMHDVPGHERHLAEGRHDEFLVHEDVHVRPSRPGFVHDAVAGAGARWTARRSSPSPSTWRISRKFPRIRRSTCRRGT